MSNNESDDVESPLSLLSVVVGLTAPLQRGMALNDLLVRF